MLLDEQIEEIKSVLVPELSPYFIILFDSTAVGRERKSSDIDLAFLGAESRSAYQLFMIVQQIIEKHLVDFESFKEVVLKKII